MTQGEGFIVEAVLANLYEKGLPWLLISFAEPFFGAFLVYYFMRRLLPNRLNVRAIVVLALFHSLLFNLRNPELLKTNHHLLINAITNGLTLSTVIFFFKGKLWKRAIVWWYFDLIKTMFQAISYLPFLYHANRSDNGDWFYALRASVDSDATSKFLYTLVFVAFSLLLGFLSLAMWRRILMRKFHLFYLFFIALPMGQRYSLANTIHPGMGDWFFGILINFVDDAATAYGILSLFGIIICIAADIAIFQYILSHDKRAAIEAELQETRRAMELEKIRYGELERQNEELAKIRHDFNTQLAAVIWLACVGEENTAREMISALTGEVSQTEKQNISLFTDFA